VIQFLPSINHARSISCRSIVRRPALATTAAEGQIGVVPFTIGIEPIVAPIDVSVRSPVAAIATAVAATLFSDDSADYGAIRMGAASTG